MYNKYKTCLLKKDENLTIADVLLFHEIHRKTNSTVRTKCCYIQFVTIVKDTLSNCSSVKFSATRLSRLLVQCAVEHLTAFRVSESRDFSSVRNIVTNDFEAMYAYKCHLYEECFRICKKC
jgi:hypothetical protein